jgi:hypothetical protein
MNRYDSIKSRIAEVKTAKFFVLNRVSSESIRTFEASWGTLPSDYKDFVAEFGQVDLFRDTKNPWHRLRVFFPPSEFSRDSEGICLQIGYYLNTGYSYLKWRDGTYLGGGAVYVGDSIPTKRYAESFEKWFSRSFALAEKSYSTSEWQSIVAGPPPFSERDRQIVQAIPLFKFRKVGVSDNGNILVEVQNCSDMELPFLTVGVHLKKSIDGSIVLPIAGLKPGETRIVERECYRQVVEPQRVDLFRLPLPEPEDRQYYYEFGIPGWLRSLGVNEL